MADDTTIILVGLTAVATAWAILATLVPKRKELRDSLRKSRTRITDGLGASKLSGHAIGSLMLISAALGAALYYLLPSQTSLVFLFIFLAWFIAISTIFRNPRWETRQQWSRREIDQIVQQRLKEEREKSPAKA